MSLVERLSPALAPEGRRREAATYLVAAGLEGLVTAGPDGLHEHLVTAYNDAARSGLPLLTDDVTHRFEERQAAELATILGGLLGRALWQAADGELLGPLFEGGLAADQRKRLGQYYTPVEIIDFLLDRALGTFDPLAGEPYRIIDPACGAGNFLAPAAERMVAAYRENRKELARLRPGERWDDAAIAAVVYRDHLAGLDIDPWAVRVARIRMRLKALALGCKAAPEPRLGHGDALKRGTDSGHGILADRYRAVVGNPPYGAELSPKERAYVAARYDLGKGRYDTTALFVERGLELLEPGGRLALVVPHGITRTGAYGPCRDLLLRDSSLVALLDAGQAFPGVNLEAVAFVAEKHGGVEKHGRAEKHGGAYPKVELASLRSGKLEHLGEQSFSFYLDRPTVPIYVPGEVGTLVARLEKLGTPLEDLARIRRGSPISARDAALFDPSEAIPLASGQSNEPSGVRVVRGRDISRYAPIGRLPLLVLRRETPLFGAHGPSALATAHIGYQNIASVIVATMLPSGTLPLDTVNVLELRPGSPGAARGGRPGRAKAEVSDASPTGPDGDLDIMALLGFLNSRLAAFYFRLAIANMANLTVHLDAPTLGSLPVVLIDPWEVGQRASVLLELRRSGAGPVALDEAAKAVDDAVFAQAGLTPAERAVVLQHTEPSLAGLSRRRSHKGH